MLTVRALDSYYGGAHILHGVSLTVNEGEAVALLGRNGAGKSTTLKSIMGLVPPKSGSVSYRDADLTRAAPHAVCRTGIGYVPEDRRIFEQLTVAENLEVGRRAARPDTPEWTPEKLFHLFPNLKERGKSLGREMSGGEQQMLTIARTLMGNPRLVLLDEPSEGLAPVIVERMAFVISELKREGLAVLISEQNLHFAKLVSDRVYIIEKGTVEYHGTFEDLAAHPEVQRKYLAL